MIESLERSNAPALNCSMPTEVSDFPFEDLSAQELHCLAENLPGDHDNWPEVNNAFAAAQLEADDMQSHCDGLFVGTCCVVEVVSAIGGVSHTSCGVKFIDEVTSCSAFYLPTGTATVVTVPWFSLNKLSNRCFVAKIQLPQKSQLGLVVI